MENNQVFEPTYINIEYFFNVIYEFFAGGAGADSSFGSFANLFSIILGIFGIIKALVPVIAIICITGILYCVIRIWEIENENKKRFQPVIDIDVPDQKYATARPRWDSIEQHINSNNPANWKLAIIEANAILEDMVRAMGYDGGTVGEMLNTIDVSDFNTLPLAKEANRVRNRIAHEPDFMLPHKEARRIIGLYEQVFKEFQYL